MQITEQKNISKARSILLVWLCFVLFLVLAMIIIGGVTRLSGSGLSITQWHLVTGIKLPLNQQEWLAEFSKYQNLPQYHLINYNMTLPEFKNIYLIEWTHRLLGRIIGLAFIVPYLLLQARGKINANMTRRMATIAGLIILEGIIGWWMVSSGLKIRTLVSQYRLAIHLSMAFTISAIILWTIWDIWRPTKYEASAKTFLLSIILTIAIACQIILGAFMAGLGAGLTYNNWPLMDGYFLPPGMFTVDPLWLDPFENITTIQFLHRNFAFVVLGLAGLLWRVTHWKFIRPLIIALLLQITLGILTLLTVVTPIIAILHQIGAWLVFALSMRLVYRSCHENAN